MAQKKHVDELDVADGDEEAHITGGQEVPKYIVGWRLHSITFGLGSTISRSPDLDHS